uniref:CSON009737 protein n=1 Tax=Culicoides sonorensis TaxID=179676 RepID=A0A336K024_CULSO
MSTPTHLTIPRLDQSGRVISVRSSVTSNVSHLSCATSNGAAPVKKKPISKFRQYLPQILAVSVKNILLLAYGMTLGIATIVIPAVSEPSSEEELSLTKTQISWFSSINLICVPFGCVFSGMYTQALGRRRAMQTITVPIFVSWMLFYYAQNVWYLYGGLCLSGLSGGLMEAPVLTYVAEVTQPAIRGSLSGTGTLCIIIGVTSQFLFDRVSTVTLENPTGYMSRKEKLRQFKDRSFVIPFILVSLAFFIGHFSGMTTLQTYAVQIFHTLKAPLDKYYATLLLGVVEIVGAAICISVIHYTGKRPLALISTVGCGICFLGTATYANFLGEIKGFGVSNVVSNVSDIKLDTKFLSVQPLQRNDTNTILSDILGLHESAALLANDYIEEIPDMNDTYYDSFMNDSQLLESLVTIKTITVNETSEEPESGIFIPLAGSQEENKYAWIPLTLLLGSALLSHSGIRLLPWILIGEVFPSRVRATGAGLTSGIGYFFGFLANKLFLSMISTMTLPGTFWFYSGISLLGALILFWILPETEGRTLLEIEDHFRGKGCLDTTNPNITPKKHSAVSNRTFQLDVKQWTANREFEKNLQEHNYNPRAVLNSAHKRGDIIVSVPSAAVMGVKKSRDTHTKSSKDEEEMKSKTNLGFEDEKEITRL